MVALQIRHVPDTVRDALTDEAEQRGESLQSYLLEVLTREASAARNRRLARTWMVQPTPSLLTIDVSELISQQHADRDRQLAEATADAVRARR